MRPLPPPPRGRPRRAPRVLALLLVCAALSFLCAATRAEAARGRPYVNAAQTTFVADNGNLLRGAIISTETGSSPSVAQLEGMKAVGLNAVHCYAERRDYGYSAGARVAAVDLAVQRTRDAGLYLVITIGGGGFDANFNSAFWSFYAPRYAHETHVLYEIQNEPAAGSPPYSGNAALMQMQLTCYDIIRAAAPDTPVMFMSYSSFENGPGVLQDIAALGSSVDWSKACIAFHGYGERGPAAIRQCLETVLAAGYPCFQTEFYRWPWGTGNFALGSGPSLYQDVDETGDLERLGVSWLSFLTITGVTNAARFKTPLNNGGVTWTPDFGTWPVPGRAVFGNGGEPRLASRATTVRIQAEDFDLGGQGVAYHDATATNSGGAYRPGEGVDIQTTTDTGGGHNVGWISSGEWLEYTTIIREAGLYTLGLRVASPQTSNSLRVRLAGVDLTGAWAFAGTGANQTWTTISRTVNLPPGQQVLRVEALSTGFNLNWIEIAPVSAGVLPNGAYRVLARSTGKALGVVGASTSNGAKLEQRSYAAATHQRWTFTHRGANHYTITSAQTGRAIDSAAGSSLSGDNLGMWGVSGSVGTLNQRWIVTATDSGHHKLINATPASPWRSPPPPPPTARVSRLPNTPAARTSSGLSARPSRSRSPRPTPISAAWKATAASFSSRATSPTRPRSPSTSRDPAPPSRARTTPRRPRASPSRPAPRAWRSPYPRFQDNCRRRIASWWSPSPPARVTMSSRRPPPRSPSAPATPSRSGSPPPSPRPSRRIRSSAARSPRLSATACPISSAARSISARAPAPPRLPCPRSRPRTATSCSATGSSPAGRARRGSTMSPGACVMSSRSPSGSTPTPGRPARASSSPSASRR